MKSVHIVHPDDISHLPSVASFPVRAEDVPALLDNEWFTSIQNSSEIILYVKYRHSERYINDLADKVKASIIWLHGFGVTEWHNSLKLIAGLSNRFRVIATLDGKFNYGCAGNYAELKRNYLALLENSQADIAFPVMHMDAWNKFAHLQDGFDRFSVIYRLVFDGVWDLHRAYYLLEFTNPAELSCYSHGFSHAVKNSINGVLSSRCHSDSRYGIRYALSVGCLDIPDDRKLTAYTHSQQYTTFANNYETVAQFIQGDGGIDLWNSYKERLNEVNV